MLDLLVYSITYRAEGIRSIDLRAPDRSPLPPFTAGAHIDVHISDQIIRSYSLINPQSERHRYVIAVNRDAASRGGSVFMHGKLQVGAVIQVRPPRNNFPLAEDGAESLLIAGGIGITPLWCMIQRLVELKRPWELYYSARTRLSAAFLPELAEAAEKGGTLHLNFDQEAGGKMLDIAAIVDRVRPEAHLYCCGPVPMLAAFEAACAARCPDHVHVEYFSPKEASAVSGGFSVILARSGEKVQIPKGRTILDTLLDRGVKVSFSCREGSCGTCETKVLEGIPDHRDVVLSKAEKDSNRTMMICCSGAKSDTLVLDL